MGLLQYLEQRLRDLERDRIETTQSIEILLDKYSKAAEKSHAESDSEHYRKWSEILRGLQGQLEKARIHITSVEAEIEEKKAKLSETRQKARLEAAQKLKRLKEIIAMPAEEFAGLSFEDMELLQEHELSIVGEGPSLLERLEQEAAGVALPDQGGGEAAKTQIEPQALEAAEIRHPSKTSAPAEAGSPSDAISAGESAAAPPSQEVPAYVAALRKMSSNTIGSITLGELNALAEFYCVLMEQPGTDPQLLRTRSAVASSLRRLAEECARLQQAIDHTLGASSGSNGPVG